MKIYELKFYGKTRCLDNALKSIIIFLVRQHKKKRKKRTLGQIY